MSEQASDTPRYIIRDRHTGIFSLYDSVRGDVVAITKNRDVAEQIAADANLYARHHELYAAMRAAIREPADLPAYDAAWKALTDYESAHDLPRASLVGWADCYADAGGRWRKATPADFAEDCP